MDKIVYRKKDGLIIKGFQINIFVKDGDYFLTDLKVYADGYIDCLGSINLMKLKEYLLNGKLSRTLPENAKLFIQDIGYITVIEADETGCTDERFIEIIEEKINELNDERNERKQLFEFFKEYLINANQISLNKLLSKWDLLTIEEKRTFESDYFEPLITVLNTKVIYTSEKRLFLLEKYFQGEWLEVY